MLFAFNESKWMETVDLYLVTRRKKKKFSENLEINQHIVVMEQHKIFNYVRKKDPICLVSMQHSIY